MERGEVELEKISTQDNPADMLTKPVPRLKFQHGLDQVSFGDLEKKQ